MPLCFWAAQTMDASDLLGANCGASMPDPRAAPTGSSMLTQAPRHMASASFSPDAAAITIQTAYRRYYLSNPELCPRIAPTPKIVYEGDKAPWIPAWKTKEALLHTAALLIQAVWLSFLSRKENKAALLIQDAWISFLSRKENKAVLLIQDAWFSFLSHKEDTAAFLIQDAWFRFLSRKLDNG